MSVARFRWGSQVYDVNSAPWAVGMNCIPPGGWQAYAFAGGTSANKHKGADLVWKRTQNAEWSFDLRLMGSGAEYLRMEARRLASFISQHAGDTATPLYFEWKPDDLPEPLWGQLGAALRYEVVAGYVALGEMYGDSMLRGQGYFVPVTLTVKQPIGARQAVAIATGGIVEDESGLIVAEATTNKCTNPVFGNATWNTGWTAAANIIESKNVDPTLIKYGRGCNARLTSKSNVSYTYTQSINVGNTNTHALSAIVRRPDGAAVTSADCMVCYGTTKADSIYRSLGDGWYLVSWVGAGIAAGAVTGLSIPAGRTIILDAFHIEEKDHPTPICTGDMLGCAWTGTAHASTSTRTIGQVLLPTSAISASGGNIRVILKANQPYTRSTDGYLFYITPFQGYFKAADDKFYFTDGTNTISSAAQTFAIGDILVLDFSWGPFGIRIDKNGINIATGATFTPPTITGYYIGTSGVPANPSGDLIQAFTIIGAEQTTAQNLASYNTISSRLTSGKRLDYIPWQWTKDGDGIIDNSDVGAYQNWAIIAGVPGSDEADTEWLLKENEVTAAGRTIRLSLSDNINFYKPTNYLTANISTTTSVDTTAVAIGSKTIPYPEIQGVLDKDLSAIVALADAGSNLQFAFQIIVGSATGASIITDYKPIIANAGNRAFMTYPLYIFDKNILIEGYPQTLTASILFKRSATGAANVSVYDARFMLQRVAELRVITGGHDSWRIHGKNWDNEAASYIIETGMIRGSEINLVPNAFNTLLVSIKDSTEVQAADTLTISKLYVTPRWSLF